MNGSSARGGRLLRALGRRLSRRSADGDSDTSCSSDSGGESQTNEPSSCSSSDSSIDEPARHRRHGSTISLRRVFHSLNLTARSQSCSPTDTKRHTKKQTQPQRILRPPVTYTYIRGPSGLPTLRVPRRTAQSAGQHR